MKYRPEVDGLRALAVVPVILFHAGFERFGGGFVGVDVFFVISGYLITSIILNELTAGQFNLAAFYERRARRILPALFVMILVCLPFAWLWLLPKDFDEFGQSIAAVMLFGSNFLFWLQSSYFDQAAELKPLLHTWSLAVEEQYYILFPLFLMLMWRHGQRCLLVILMLLFGISLSAAQWGAWHAPTASFFLLPTRGWELLAGSFVAFYLRHQDGAEPTHPHLAQSASLVGLTFVLFAVFSYNDQTPFPSFYALMPVLGAALIIVFAVKGTLVYALLSHRLLVGIGLISYSAYLWHQPLFAFARYLAQSPPGSTPTLHKF